MHRLSFLLLLFISCKSLPTEKASWIEKPITDWPAIALVNDVLYKNGDKHQDPNIPYIGTGFLVDVGKDTIAVTAKHILFAARNKATDRVMVNGQLAKWKMYPKNNPQDSVIIGRLINEDPQELLFSEENGALQRDWLVFTTNYISPKITPLTISARKAVVGDQVFLIGNPYNFDNTLQVGGTITKVADTQLFINFDGMEKQMLGGASGSPVVNADGQLIGIFSNSVGDPKTGERTYLIVTTDYLQRILRGEQPLNVNKRSASAWLDSLIRKDGVKAALQEFDKVRQDPAAASVYEWHYINRGQLLRIGEELLNNQSPNEAIAYLTYMSEHYGDTYFFFISLAKAYVKQGQKEMAVKVLKDALDEVYESDRPEIEKVIKEIQLE